MCNQKQKSVRVRVTYMTFKDLVQKRTGFSKTQTYVDMPKQLLVLKAPSP